MRDLEIGKTVALQTSAGSSAVASLDSPAAVGDEEAQPVASSAPMVVGTVRHWPARSWEARPSLVHCAAAGRANGEPAGPVNPEPHPIRAAEPATASASQRARIA